MKTVVERVGVDAASDEASDVGHIGHEQGADFLADGGNAVKIGNFHEGGIANQDDFGAFGEGELFELVVINIAVGGGAVGEKIIDFGAAGDG